MAEALAGLGVAASIAQFAMIGLQGVSLMREAYQSTGGLLERHDELLAISKDIQHHCEELERAETATAKQPSNSQILPILQKAHNLATELEKELNALTRSADVGCAPKLRLSFRAWKKNSRIQGLHQSLSKLREEIVLILLATAKLTRPQLLAQVSSLEVQVHEHSSLMARDLDAIHQRIEALQANSDRPLSDSDLARIVNEITTLASNALLRFRIEGVLQSLHFKQISERLSDIPEAHANTFRWSLESNQITLPTWLETGTGIYWISGKAGSGKSTLVKFLTREPKTREYLEKWADGKHLSIMYHFFWAPGTRLQRNLEGLFRTLLFQILITHPQLTSTVCPERTDTAGFKHLESWTLQDLKQCFVRLSSLKALPAKFCFFIDGLDEFRGSTEELIAIIKAISGCSDIKLCVSSRPWPEFCDAFNDRQEKLDVQDLTRDDIVRYVEDNLSQSNQYVAMRSNSPQDAKFFQDDIVLRADGVFLWVYLVTRSLLRGLQYDDDIPTLRRRLVAFPRELEDYFENMLKSIDPIYYQETGRILSILTFSEAPLSPYLVMACIFVYQDLGDLSDLSTNPDRPSPSGRNLPRGFNDPKHADFRTPDVPYPGDIPKTPNRRNIRIVSSTRRTTWDEILGDEGQLRKQIAVRCKDLVHIYEPPAGGDNYDGRHFARVGFLHRTVPDFLTGPRITRILEDQRGVGFHPILALAQARLYAFLRSRELATKSLIGDSGQINNLLWALSLCKEGMGISGQGDERISDCLGSMLYDGPLWKEIAAALQLSRYQVQDPDSLLYRLGLLSTIEASKSIFPSPNERAIENLGGLNGVNLLGPALSIKPDDEDYPQLRRENDIDLAQLKDLLGCPKVKDFILSSKPGSGWMRGLVQLVQIPEALGANVYDALVLLISQGAPRYIYVDNRIFNQSRIWEDVLAPVEYNTPDSRLRSAPSLSLIDTTKVLRQIPTINSRSPNGMEDLFVCEYRTDNYYALLL